ncbi:MAG TPA: flagellar basal-body rod protein FlgF [Allosphingosinicella sp.]
MLGAIYIGLSGMSAYSKGLQTISNNVANLNTPGYKSSTTSFSDTFSYGGGGLTFTGGTDLRQSGTGVSFDQPHVDFRQGDLRQTGNDLDLAIQGSGFLALLGGGKTYYARTGEFVVDSEGFISQRGTGHRLAMLDSSRQLVPINIDSKRSSLPAATTRISFADNLSSSATEASVANIAVFDSRGGQQNWQVKFQAVGATAPNQWTVTVTDQTGATVGTSTLKFIGGTVDPTTSKLTIATTPAGADPLSVELDFSNGVTSFSSGTVSTIRAASVDGSGAGALTSVTFDADGKVKLVYSNGKSELLGSVAVADFRNPQDLTRVGDGLFVQEGNGERRFVASGSEGAGKLVSRQMEASNVDLAQQFGELIIIQRGFQASSQVVSVSNDMIQQLFAMRGQG